MRQLEQDYRDGLDSLRFSNEAKERMMKNLTNQTERGSTKRHSVRPLRTALIAAALCGVLVLTAGAAVVYQLTVRVVNNDYAGYLAYGDFTQFPLSDFSPELIVACEENRDPFNIVQPTFATKEEAWDFIGRTIPCIWAGSDDVDQDNKYRVILFQNEESRQLDGIEVRYYGNAPIGISINIGMTIFADTMTPPEGWDGSVGGMLEGQDRQAKRLDSYTLPNGAVAEIVMIYGTEDAPFSQCYGNFLYKGVVYQVRVDGRLDMPDEEFRAQVQTVLDGFE